jgi:hypothetical protein
MKEVILQHPSALHFWSRPNLSLLVFFLLSSKFLVKFGAVVVMLIIAALVTVVIVGVIAEKSITSLVGFLRAGLTTGVTVLTMVTKVVVFDVGDEGSSVVCLNRSCANAYAG